MIKKRHFSVNLIWNIHRKTVLTHFEIRYSSDTLLKPSFRSHNSFKFNNSVMFKCESINIPFLENGCW